MVKRNIFTFIAVIFFTGGCRHDKPQPRLSAADVNKLINEMTGLMVHDVTNPPVAARFFAYTYLAGYEMVSQNTGMVKSIYGRYGLKFLHTYGCKQKAWH